MSEYTVGSLADLISGKKTPNKPGVVKKQFKMIEKQMPPIKTNNKRKRSESETTVKSRKTKKQRNRSRKNEVEDDVEKNRNVAAENMEESQESIEDNVGEEESENSDNDENKVLSQNTSSINLSPEEINERESRTIFVGNLPLQSTRSTVKQFFKKFGPIETIRLRSIPLGDPRLPKKVAVMRKAFHGKRNSLNCYIRYLYEEDAKMALSANGMEYKEHHLRVDMAISKGNHEEKKAIFVGNVAFDAEEDEIWKLFEDCGPIISVRIIRDPKTNVGKGFAYVNFESVDAVELALQLENVMLRERILRVSASKSTGKKPKTKPLSNKMAFMKRKGENFKGKRDGFDKQEVFAGKGFMNSEKKNKINKGALNKKKLADQLAPKPQHNIQTNV